MMFKIKPIEIGVDAISHCVADAIYLGFDLLLVVPGFWFSRFRVPRGIAENIVTSAKTAWASAKAATACSMPPSVSSLDDLNRCRIFCFRLKGFS